MQQRGASPFLDCLDRLDEAALATVLLPKLHSTVKNLALTCTRLRELVHGSHCKQLNLSGLANGIRRKRIKAWTAALPAHFRSCQRVELCISDDRSYDVVKKLMPALQG